MKITRLRFIDSDFTDESHKFLKILSVMSDEEFLNCVCDLVESGFWSDKGESIFEEENFFVVQLHHIGNVLNLEPRVFWQYLLIALKRQLEGNSDGFHSCQDLISTVEGKITQL